MGDNIEQVSYSPTSLNSYDYTYDKVGNATDKDYDTLAYDFTYDKVYQLTDAEAPGSSDDWNFSYDGVYNRTSITQDTTTSTYTLNSGDGLNQYSSLTNPSVTFSYDDNGNLTDDGTWKYVYDKENRLTTLKNQADATIATYTYDWAGRRTEKTISGSPDVTTKYIYDGAHVVAEYEDSSLVRKYIYGPGIDFPVAMYIVSGDNAGWYYYLHDAQRSVVALLNNSGTIVEGYTYGPYGEPKVHTAVGADSKWLTTDDTTGSTSTYDNPYMFTARRLDEESGIYYYRARMYHPDLGRFLQPDPIGYYDSMNLYQYCLNNSINFIDPLGLTSNSTSPFGNGFIDQQFYDFFDWFRDKGEDINYRAKKAAAKVALDAAKKAAAAALAGRKAAAVGLPLLEYPTQMDPSGSSQYIPPKEDWSKDDMPSQEEPTRSEG